MAEDNDKHNTNLKTLEVEGYEIKFDKYKKIYSIEVQEEVNTLKVKAKQEVDTSTVKITGADDLEANNNKVTIEVTAQNKDTKTYVINVEKIKKQEAAKKTDFKIKDEYIEYGKYAIIGLLALIIIIFIVIKIRDRIVEKDIDKL